jgi:hypothetical protein
MCTDQFEARRDQAVIRLGTRTPACSAPACNETDPLALTGRAPDLRCYECDRLARGKPWVEQQHPAGQHNHSATVPIPGNDHRVVDSLKHDWPRDTLRNADSSPLLIAAACLRGWLDTLQLIIGRTVGWIPTFLEALHAWLLDRLGAGWWHELTWAVPS